MNVKDPSGRRYDEHAWIKATEIIDEVSSKDPPITDEMFEAVAEAEAVVEEQRNIWYGALNAMDVQLSGLGSEVTIDVVIDDNAEAVMASVAEQYGLPANWILRHHRFLETTCYSDSGDIYEYLWDDHEASLKIRIEVPFDPTQDPAAESEGMVDD